MVSVCSQRNSYLLVCSGNVIRPPSDQLHSVLCKFELNNPCSQRHFASTQTEPNYRRLLSHPICLVWFKLTLHLPVCYSSFRLVWKLGTLMGTKQLEHGHPSWLPGEVSSFQIYSLFALVHGWVSILVFPLVQFVFTQRIEANQNLREPFCSN